MAFLQGKTPISFLQELCTKRGTTPQYDLIANEGAVHEPTFVFKVTAGEFLGTGKGPSKKKAKHNAAQSILNQMTGVSNGADPVTAGYGDGSGDQAGSDGQEGNPVGELQEMTQKKLWPPPIYEFTTEQGPPHAREFVCTIRLFTFSEQAVGKSKKLAKRNAACAMVKLIKQGIAQPQTESAPVEDLDEARVPLPSGDYHDLYKALKEENNCVATLTPQASQTISQFYANLKAKTGRGLTALQNQAINSMATNFCQLLQEIAEEQRFEVTYVDIPELSRSGLHQCLVQLSCLPVAVCHGSAKTKDEAHAQAAHNALQYLRIMTKK